MELSFKSHPSENLLEEYAFGRIAEEQLAPLEEHLLVCSTCQESLEEIDEYLLLMKRGMAEQAVSPPQPEIRKSWWPDWISKFVPRGTPHWVPNFAWTAAGALACLMAAVYLSHRPVQPPVPIALVSIRGEANVHAPSNRPLNLQLDAGDSAVPDYRVEIVTASGKPVWSAVSQPSNGKIEVDLKTGLTKGRYWVRLYASNQLRTEIGLQVE